MPIYNSSTTYGSVARWLHWLIALMVILMLCGGLLFSYLPKSDFRNTLMFVHKSTGVTLLILMFVRLLWRWANPYPQLPNTMHLFEKITARTVHLLFYLLLIIMPLTGLVMSMAAGYPVPFWGVISIHWSFIPTDKLLAHWMKSWHLYLAWTIFIFIVLHTFAALIHQLFYKDNVLTRMWRG